MTPLHGLQLPDLALLRDVLGWISLVGASGGGVVQGPGGRPLHVRLFPGRSHLTGPDGWALWVDQAAEFEWPGDTFAVNSTFNEAG